MKNTKELEIDLLDLFKMLLNRRNLIFKISVIFFILGILVAFTSKIEYEASCKLMPESQEGIKGSLGGLGGLAGLAGIDLGLGGTGFLTPDLYPEIVKSIPFQLDLIHQPIRFQKLDTLVSSYLYFRQIDRPTLFGWIFKYSIGLPSQIRSHFSEPKKSNMKINSNIIQLSKVDWELIESYKERVTVSVDSKTGVILVKSEMPDAYAAANLTDLVVKKLTSEITDYKIEKVRVNLDFIKERYNESEIDYKFKQKELARFTDRNKNITSSMVQTEYQRLQNELNIAFEVYKGLATQLEQAKIKVKEETPVFTVLEPVKVPIDKSSPHSVMILILFTFMGLVVGSTYILFIEFSLLKKHTLL